MNVEVEHGDLPPWAQKCHDALMELLLYYRTKQEEAHVRAAEAHAKGYRIAEPQQTIEYIETCIQPVLRDLCKLEMLRPLRVLVRPPSPDAATVTKP